MKKSKVKNQNSKKVSKEKKCADVSTSNASSSSSKATKKTPPPTPVRYNVRPGTIDFGKDYEIQIAALLVLRCCDKSTRDMWLGMNLEESGDFDDIVLYRKAQDGKEFLYMIQLKFNMKSEDISLGDFKKENGNFSLKKYITSIYNLDKSIRSHSESKDASEIIDYFKRKQDKIVFVIFTNRPMADQSLCNNVNVADWMHNVILTGGKAFKFDYSKFNLSLESTLEKYTQNMFLLTEQIHIKDLSAVITKEIGKLTQPLKLTTGQLKKVVDNFLLFITNWSKGRLGGYYPITKDHVWKVLLEQVFTPYMIKLDEMEGNGMFENKLWMHIIEDKDITVIRTDDLVCEFLYNYIRSEIKKNCADYKKLRGSKPDDIAKQTFQVVIKSKVAEFEIYDFLWKSRQLPLVLKVDESEELEIILQKLESFRGLFRIIILTESVSASSRTTTLKTFTTINDLTINHRTEILEHSVKLQGRTFVKLADLITADMYCYLTVGEVIKIISGNFIIGNLPPYLPHTFVDRSLEKVWLKNEVLQETLDNVFLIKCNLLNDFEFFVQTNKLKTNESKIYKCPKLESEFDSLNNIDIIIFENECNFNKIRILGFLKSRNVHYLSLHATQNLEWIASFGSTRNIRKFRENSNSCYLLETHNNMNDLIEATRYRNFQFPKLITGCPGMGKSFLIDYINVRASVDMWILKINLPDHSDYFRNVKFGNTSSAELEHLLYFCNKTLLQNDNDNITKEVFKQYLDSKKIFLMLDAFDEVPILYQNNVKKIIKSINDAGFPLCTTTRPFLKTELEELLDTFAVTIKPFSQIDQTTYLIKHFCKFVKVSKNNELLNEFVNKLLEVAKKRINDQDLEFTGVPLLMTLLAEAFEDDCLNFINSRRFTTEYFDLLNLCRYFIDKKEKIACEKFGSITIDISDLYKSHKAYYALQLLFSEDDLKPLNIKELLEHEIRLHPKILRLLQTDGIVVPQNNTHVIFVHRSFAEFLVAKWLFENVNTEYRETVQNLVKKTFEPNFAFIRNIFDRMLAIGCPLHLAVINLDVDQVKEIVDSNASELNKHDEAGRSVFHLIASWGVYHPVNIKLDEVNSLKETISKDRAIRMLKILPSNSISNAKDTVLEFTPLDYAIFSSSLNVADAICRQVKCLNHRISIYNYDLNYMHFYLNIFYGSLKSVIIRQTVLYELKPFFQKVMYQNGCEDNLHSAVRSGNLNKVTTLVSRGHDINQTDKTGSTPMHIAVILVDVVLVKLLLENEPNLNIKDMTGKTPLHWAAIMQNKHIIRLLLSYSPDIKITDNRGMTALHYSVLADTNNKDDILRAFVENTYIYSTITIQDEFGKTALHYALHFNQTENLKLLLKYGTPVNVTNTEPTKLTNSEPELHHSDQVVKLLSCTDTHGATVFHWAADKGQVDMLNLFLDYGAIIDEKDSDGRTALISSAEKGLSDVVQFLLERGANVEAQNQYGASALIATSINGHSDTVHLLLNKQATIEAKDNEGSTSLFCAAYNGHTNVVQLLLEWGANVEAQDQYGRTALMAASINGHSDTVHLLLNKQAKIESKDNEGITSLFYASHKGQTNVVQLLLERGANVEAQNQYGRTTLMAASINGHSDTVHLLLNKQAKIEAKDNEGITSLLCASPNGHTNVVKLLLDRGANVEAQDQYGRTALMAASINGHSDTVHLLLNKQATIESKNNEGYSSLLCAANNGHTIVVQLLLERGASIEAQDQNGRTTLMHASQNGHTDIVQLLLNKRAAIEVNDNKGATSLFLAAYNGHTNVVQLLLEKGINIEAQIQDGMTALIGASINGHTKTVQLLLNNHAAIEAKDNNGLTSLVWAAHNGHTNVVQLLLAKGVNIEAQHQNGTTPLMYASKNGHSDTVQLLLNKNAAIEASGNDRMTSLLLAAHNGHTNVIQLLLERGANIEASGNDGKTPFILAARNGHTNVVQLLLEKGVNIEAQDQYGMTALTVASQNGHTGTVQLLLNNHAAIQSKDNKGLSSLVSAAYNGHTNVVQLLLERGANTEAQNRYVATALLLASRNGHTETVQLLLNKHATIEASDTDGNTSLLSAAPNGHTNVVQLLLEWGANIEAQNQYGRTALMAASANGHTGTVQLLINNLAAIEAKDNEGATALYLAAAKGHIDVVKMLINKGADFENKCNSGKTALMVASEGKHTAVVYLLSSKIKLKHS